VTLLLPSSYAHQTLASPVELMIMLFVIAIIPVVAVSMTSFTRIIVVLGLLRAALGTASLPPNAVLVALAVMLSAAIMAPTFSAVKREAVVPYQAHRITIGQALTRAERPMGAFMIRQTRPIDIRAFDRIAGVKPAKNSAPPFEVLVPAFLTSELRIAFAMGFALALPFAIVDLIVAIVLMSLGMFMVAPNAVSLPIKLLLFVVADGWTLVAGALAASFR